MLKKLRTHIFSTFLSLRVGMAVVAALFPIILWLVGLTQGIQLLDSMSAYYHASPITRDMFVGILFAVGLTLFFNKGFDLLEEWTINLAGVFAIGVALNPKGVMNFKEGTFLDTVTDKLTVVGDTYALHFSTHGIFAVLFFLCIGFVC